MKNEMGRLLDIAIILLYLTCPKSFHLINVEYKFRQLYQFKVHINENSFNKNNEGNYTCEQIFIGGMLMQILGKCNLEVE